MRFLEIPPSDETIAFELRAERCSVAVYNYAYGQYRIIVSAAYPFDDEQLWRVHPQFCTYKGETATRVLLEIVVDLAQLAEDASAEQIEAALATIATRYGGEREGRVRLDNWTGVTALTVYQPRWTKAAEGTHAGS